MIVGDVVGDVKAVAVRVIPPPVPPEELFGESASESPPEDTILFTLRVSPVICTEPALKPNNPPGVVVVPDSAFPPLVNIFPLTITCAPFPNPPWLALITTLPASPFDRVESIPPTKACPNKPPPGAEELALRIERSPPVVRIVLLPGI